MLAAVAVFALVLDVISKMLVVRNVDPARPIRLLGGLIHVTNTRNAGAAFSFAAGSGATIVFGLVAVVVIVIIVRSARRIRSLWWSLGLGLLLGGATGNLMDRIFRAPGVMRGHVVDWIQFPHFAIFNLADSAIVGGGILLAVLATMGIEMDGRRTTKAKS
ncbi:MAG: signal peptidase [Frankiaceae bacterium]|nr:signal peptidase [Frankiaceae bacterium]